MGVMFSKPLLLRPLAGPAEGGRSILALDPNELDPGGLLPCLAQSLEKGSTREIAAGRNQARFQGCRDRRHIKCVPGRTCRNDIGSNSQQVANQCRLCFDHRQRQNQGASREVRVMRGGERTEPRLSKQQHDPLSLFR